MITWRRRDAAPTIARGTLAFLFALLFFSFTPPASAAPTGALSISLEGTTPEFVTLDDEISFTGTVTNSGDDEVTGLTIWWRMRTQALTDDTLDQWLEGSDEVQPVTLARYDIDEPLAPGGDLDFDMEIPAESSPFDFGSQAGPRGIELIVTGTAEEGRAVEGSTRSVLLWYTADTEIHATIAAPLAPAREEWATALDREVPVARVSAPRILEVVEAFADIPLTWGVDAALVDSTPLGQWSALLPAEESLEPEDAPPDSALDWPEEPAAARIAHALEEHRGPRGVISLGWATPDHRFLVRAGDAGALLRQRNLDSAGEVLRDAGLAPLPGVLWSLTDLTPWEATRVGAGVTTLFLPPESPRGPLHPPTAGGLTLRSPDPQFMDLIMHRQDPLDLLARSLILSRDLPDVLIALPADLDADQAEIAAQNLAVLTTAPWFSPLTPASSGIPPAPNAAPAPATDTGVEMLTEALDRIDRLAPLTEDPQRFTDVFTAGAYLSVSNVWDSAEETASDLRRAVVDAARTEVLTIEQPSTVNLISQGGELPIGVDNSSTITLSPTVVLHPGDARLVSEEPVQATLGPGGRTTVRLPITAVANGNVSATIRLVNPDGEEVAAPQNFTVRVRADWETTGTAILAGVVAVGFIAGLVHNIRTARRRRFGGER